MILISHRGNINGSKPEMENKPEYIQQALDLGYDVEIDVWLIDGNFFLGQDEPQYQVHGTFLMKKGLWCHAKNIDAFYLMSLDNRIHCFSHDKDEVALTSRGYFWSSSENKMTSKSICVMPPNSTDLPKNIAGVCSDNVGSYND